MTQLSNVPMQLNPNAVEPLTLIEKLEQRLQKLQKSMKNSNDSEHYAHLCSRESGFLTAFSIVKQHQTWRQISSDEKPIDMQICNLLVDNESEESPTLYDIALFRKYKDEDVWLCMTRPEEHIDPSKILAWQPMGVPSDDFFNNLQLPSGEGNDKPSD